MGMMRRSLGLILAMALVVAGLPAAHAMPQHVMPQHAMPQDVTPHLAASHHCDDMDEMAQAEAGDHAGDPGADHAATPCKCLNCSMCVTGTTAPVLRLATPERRILAVVYRIAALDLAGIAPGIDPGIPILAD